MCYLWYHEQDTIGYYTVTMEDLPYDVPRTACTAGCAGLGAVSFKLNKLKIKKLLL